VRPVRWSLGFAALQRTHWTPHRVTGQIVAPGSCYRFVLFFRQMPDFVVSRGRSFSLLVLGIAAGLGDTCTGLPGQPQMAGLWAPSSRTLVNTASHGDDSKAREAVTQLLHVVTSIHIQHIGTFHKTIAAHVCRVPALRLAVPVACQRMRLPSRCPGPAQQLCRGYSPAQVGVTADGQVYCRQ